MRVADSNQDERRNGSGITGPALQAANAVVTILAIHFTAF